MDKRPCFYRTSSKDKWTFGTFHAWSQVCSEPQTPSPCGIVEDEQSGNIFAIDVHLIRFKTPGA